MNVSGGAIALPRQVVPRHLALVLAALVAAAAIPMAVPQLVPRFSPTSAADNQCWTFSAAEKAFASKMNSARGSSRPKLRMDPELGKVAMTHTQEMVKANTLHHTSNSALKRRVTNWNTIGENVGLGGDVDGLHAAFMASPAHKANIMHSGFTNVGVGVIESGGRMWVTVIFEGKNNPGTTLKMPSC